MGRHWDARAGAHHALDAVGGCPRGRWVGDPPHLSTGASARCLFAAPVMLGPDSAVAPAPAPSAGPRASCGGPRKASEAPLHVATQGQSTFLDYGDEADVLPPPDAVVIDDANLIAGAFPERVASLAQRGALVIVSLPRHLVVHDNSDHQYLDPAWASVADVVIEVRQAMWPGSDGLRPGEADLHVFRNRWGPTLTATVAFQGHYARFVDLQ